MAKVYFGFGIADGMFNGDLELHRKDLKQDADYVQYLLNNPRSSWAEETVICLNPSHKATIDAMTKRYGLDDIQIPETAINVKLETGDSLIVMSPRGLPRLVDRHEYTDEEIEKATFNFAIWLVK